jgi:precorrin-6B methylase 2
MNTKPDIVAQRAKVHEVLDLHAGEWVLDVGVGPALLAAQMAEAVEPTGAAHGIDVSEADARRPAPPRRATADGPRTGRAARRLRRGDPLPRQDV